MRAVPPSGHFCAFGKIPARADFVTRGLSAATRRAWDEWVQQGIAACQRIHRDNWPRTYPLAPIWHFFLPAEVSGAAGLIGIMLPGFDSVGRCYPLLLGTELTQPVDPLPVIAGSNRWFAAIEALALDALEPRFDPAELERRVLPRWQTVDLPRDRPSPVDIGNGAEGIAVALPMVSAAVPVAQRLCGANAARRSLFWTVGGATMPPMLAIMPRLVSAQGFVALFDGNWRGHGWKLVRAPLHDPAPPGLLPHESWDRDD